MATTVGAGCILCADVAEDAGEQALTDTYQVYKDEVQSLKPDYSPETVNMDGWKATRNVWTTLFPAAVIICCFLHVFIIIRNRAKKKYRKIFENVALKLWECYRAESKMLIFQRVIILVEWCGNNDDSPAILDPIKKLRGNLTAHQVAYDYPKAHRTSNMIDRLMQRMDRHLYSTQYFHGSTDAAQLSIRGWTLINNFAPHNPRTAKQFNGFKKSNRTAKPIPVS